MAHKLYKGEEIALASIRGTSQAAIADMLPRSSERINIGLARQSGNWVLSAVVYRPCRDTDFDILAGLELAGVTAVVWAENA